MKEWIDAGIGPPLIGVNLSVLQFKTPTEIENVIVAILAELALPPHLLELELTESVLMEASHGSDIFHRLRDAGVRIAIDDFGSGYSSLSYLVHLPVDRIKIAQNFTADLTSNSSAAKIVKASIGLAHDLGLDVVVEGVETEAQLELIKSWDCHKVQGYYFCKPLPAEETAVFLRANALAK